MSIQEQDPNTFKIVVVGHQGVGKTSLITQYIKGTFKQDYNVTIGVEFYTKPMTVQKTRIQLQIWDTAGQEIYRSIIRSFYRKAVGVLVMFAINSQQTFHSAREWVRQVKQHVHPEACIFLVGTKLDRQSQRQISDEAAQKMLANIGGVFYAQTSAKSGENIQELFSTIGSILMKKYRVNKQFQQLVCPTDGKNARITALGNERQSGKSFSLRRPSVGEIQNPKKKKCC